MKKIIYVSNSRIPTEKAHGIQIIKMCQALAFRSDLVELILPKRKNRKCFQDIDIFKYYNVQNNFKIKKLFSFDPTFLAKLPQGVYIKFQASFFIFILFFYLYFKKDKHEYIFYTRDEYLLPLLLKFSKRVLWEAHSLPDSKEHYLKYWRRCFKIVTISYGLKKELVGLGVEADKILVAPDGVDLKNYELRIIPTAQDELRKRLGLPVDKKIIMYTGHLYEWKGAQVLADVAEFFLDNEVAVFLGGTEYDIKNFKERNQKLIEQKKVIVLGHKEPYKIPGYLKSADVLVLPNSGKAKKSKFWTSPLKMFEYMASKVPIVASDLPSIREVLNENNSVLVKPDDAKCLADGIGRILNDRFLSDKITKQAYEDVKNYSWEKRAERILEFL